jgi:hypothetical protein
MNCPPGISQECWDQDMANGAIIINQQLSRIRQNPTFYTDRPDLKAAIQKEMLDYVYGHRTPKCAAESAQVQAKQ